MELNQRKNGGGTQNGKQRVVRGTGKKEWDSSEVSEVIDRGLERQGGLSHGQQCSSSLFANKEAYEKRESGLASFVAILSSTITVTLPYLLMNVFALAFNMGVLLPNCGLIFCSLHSGLFLEPEMFSSYFVQRV